MEQGHGLPRRSICHGNVEGQVETATQRKGCVKAGAGEQARRRTPGSLPRVCGLVAPVMLLIISHQIGSTTVLYSGWLGRNSPWEEAAVGTKEKTRAQRAGKGEEDAAGEGPSQL